MDPDQLGPRPVRFSFDGTPLAAPRGLTIGGALVANGILSWSRTEAAATRGASSAGPGTASTAWSTSVTGGPCAPA